MSAAAYSIVECIYRSARDRDLFRGIDDSALREIVDEWYREVARALVGSAAGVEPPRHLLAHLRGQVA